MSWLNSHPPLSLDLQSREEEEVILAIMRWTVGPYSTKPYAPDQRALLERRLAALQQARRDTPTPAQHDDAVPWPTSADVKWPAAVPPTSIATSRTGRASLSHTMRAEHDRLCSAGGGRGPAAEPADDFCPVAVQLVFAKRLAEARVSVPDTARREATWF